MGCAQADTASMNWLKQRSGSVSPHTHFLPTFTEKPALRCAMVCRPPKPVALAIHIGSLWTAVSVLPAGESKVKVDGRTVVIHNPGHSGPLPLVLGLHGWFGSATNDGSFCGAAKISQHASSLGFIGVCPDGYATEHDQGSWNAAGCCGKAVDDDVDDVQYLRDVVTYVKQHASISKVYAMGLSNGAMMSWRLACQASDIFDGVAPFSGGWFGNPAWHVTAVCYLNSYQ
eukprot:TRINITY_DN26359_c0_g1_i3.p1 TRINITY_DN26359_c0_g1~~TRINITY_DN26359_c0_g1_i3.p1  ORF type:complete len:229 (-),score=13.63 TRINITY_DN26359_c0_g1_i3:186-872(-)